MVDDDLWFAVHLPSGYYIGKRAQFPKKKQALAYAEYLVNSDIDFDCAAEDLWTKNDKAMVERIYAEALEVGRKA